MPKKYGVKEKDLVVSHVVNLVLTGKLRSGDRLDRNEIARQLGLSRVPIQEAVVQLEHDGLVSTKYHRGAFIERFDESVLFEHHEVYGVLTGVASARAATDPAATVLDQLEALLAIMATSKGARRCLDTAWQYRQLINDQYAGPRLQAAIRAAQTFLPAKFWMNCLPDHDTLWQSYEAETAAIRAGDADAARTACVRRSAALGQIMCTELVRRGVLAPGGTVSPHTDVTAADGYVAAMTLVIRAGVVALTAVLVGVLALGGTVWAAPAAAQTDQCSPPGVASASPLPTNLSAADTGPGEDRYTTDAVVPLDRIDPAALGLRVPGVLTVGTLSDAPPSICINSQGQFTGFDNELLRAIAAKLGLQISFVGTEFSALLAQVAAGRFDVGSSSITTTEPRRRTVGFTNGYDFGYFSLVVPSGSTIAGFDQLRPGQRIGVVQGTVQESYVVDTLGLQPVIYPDYNTVYASLKTRQIDAWVAPSQQAEGTVRPGDPAQITENTFSLDNFIAYAVADGNRPLIDALNTGLDAVIADGTWARLYSDWVPRAVPPGWKPGSKAAPVPQLPDFDAIAAEHQQPVPGVAAPKSTLSQLADSFLNWELYKQAIPDLFKTGLPNTLLLTVGAGVIGVVLGMVLAIAGISRSRLLRWPARVYTDIFRGLPEVVIILLIGLGLGPVVGGVTGYNPVPLGIAALGLMAAAYVGEILRSGIQSVEPGQLEAARALGFSYPTAMRLVVVPQGVRRVLPALMNQVISLLKASSLVYFLGLVADQRELFQVGRDLNAQTGSLSPLVAAGLFYLALTIPLTHLVNYVDNRLRRGGKPSAADPLTPSTSQEMI